jgi:cobalt/nickel transport system ATP-binding protein
MKIGQGIILMCLPCTLDRLGLTGFENRVPYKLSGGEKKLVSLATVLAMEPAMLLLDEPTTGLDENTVTRITDILLSLNLPYMIISHDRDFLSATTNKTRTMVDGKLE